MCTPGLSGSIDGVDPAISPEGARLAIEREYKRECDRESDINEHLPVLRALAESCDTVAEMGVRSVVSTWAFLAGLSNGAAGHQSKHLICIDIEDPPVERFTPAQAAAAALGIKLTFMKGNSAALQLPERVDVLFIDTWHVYGHLKRELQLHEAAVKRLIVMHDTEVDAVEGESIRMGYPIDEQIVEYGYSREEVTTGLQRAVDEFLAAHTGVWAVHLKRTNNNGLTILHRIGTEEPSVV